MALLAGVAGADLSGRLAVDEARLGGGRLDLGVLPEAPPLALEVERLVLQGLAPGTAGRLEADLRLAGGGTARLEGSLGPWNGSGGAAAEAGGSPRFDLRLEVEGARLQRPAEPGAEAPDDPTRIDGELEARGRWRGGDDWLEGVEGEGRLEARGGTVPRPGVLRAVAAALLARLPEMRKGSVERLPRQTVGLREATAHLAVDAGALRTEDFVLQTEEYTLRLAGRLEEDGGLDLRGTALLTPQGVAGVFELLRVPSALRRAVRLPPVPVRVGGRLGAPQVTADASGLPRAAVAAVLGAPERLLDALKGAAEALPSRIPGREEAVDPAPERGAGGDAPAQAPDP